MKRIWILPVGSFVLIGIMISFLRLFGDVSSWNFFCISSLVFSCILALIACSTLWYFFYCLYDWFSIQDTAILIGKIVVFITLIAGCLIFLFSFYLFLQIGNLKISDLNKDEFMGIMLKSSAFSFFTAITVTTVAVGTRQIVLLTRD